MLKSLFILGLLIPINGYTQDQWLCSQSSSELRGEGAIAACGVGEGSTEGLARKEALKDARNEFDAVCAAGTECALLRYSVEPRRATCEEKVGGWKCFRLVVFRVKEEPRREITSANIIAPQSYGTMGMSNQDLIDASLRQGLLGR